MAYVFRFRFDVIMAGGGGPNYEKPLVTNLVFLFFLSASWLKPYWWAALAFSIYNYSERFWTLCHCIIVPLQISELTYSTLSLLLLFRIFRFLTQFNMNVGHIIWVSMSIITWWAPFFSRMWPFASTISVSATVIYCIILSHSCHTHQKKWFLCIHSTVKIDNILLVCRKNYIANYNLKNKVYCTLHSVCNIVADFETSHHIFYMIPYAWISILGFLFTWQLSLGANTCLFP